MITWLPHNNQSFKVEISSRFRKYCSKSEEGLLAGHPNRVQAIT